MQVINSPPHSSEVLAVVTVTIAAPEYGYPTEDQRIDARDVVQTVIADAVAQLDAGEMFAHIEST